MVVLCMSSVLYLLESSFVEKSKLNLMDTVYENDKSPLMENCDCYACKHFTKGYLHHLFNCHELLGIILL